MPDWEWSETRRRYLRNGRAVPEKRVRQTVQETVATGKETVRDVTTELVEGRIDVAEWYTRVRPEIRAAHRAAAMVAGGGQLTTSQAGRLGTQLRNQYKYLDALTRGIEAGEVKLDGRLVARIQMYVQAAQATYQNQVTQRENAAGMKFGRWILTAREHCAGCLKQSRRGVRKISTFPPIGSNECRSNCGCHIEPVARKN